MFDKFKRIIPKMFNKSKKVEVTNSSNVQSDKPEYIYRHLSNGDLYKNANIITKIWYLRGRFNWFDEFNAAFNSKNGEFDDMLDEIMCELSNLAFQQKDMNALIAIINNRNGVALYSEEMKAGNLNYDEHFHAFIPNEAHAYEKIWCLRYMYDCSIITGSKEVYSDAIKCLKKLRTELKGEESVAVQKILHDIKVAKSFSNHSSCESEF